MWLVDSPRIVFAKGDYLVVHLHILSWPLRDQDVMSLPSIGFPRWLRCASRHQASNDGTYLAYDVSWTVFYMALVLLLPEWTRLRTSFLIVSTDELSQLSLSYQGFNLLLQDVTVFSSVAMVSVEMTVEVLRPFRRVQTKFPRPLECRIVLYLQQDLVDRHVQRYKALGSFLSSAGRAYTLLVGLWVVWLWRPAFGRLESSIFWFFPLFTGELITGFKGVLRVYELLSLIHQLWPGPWGILT